MKLFGKLAAIAAGVGMVASMGAMSFANKSNSWANVSRNHGMVKVDGVPFDQLRNNEPHVGCIFQIDFFRYDRGAVARVTFVGQPPTRGGTLATDTFVMAAPAGGARGLNAARTYNLSAALAGIEPHPKQGYHVRLTVSVDGSAGVNHKVFWVRRCGPGTPPQPPPGGGPGGGPPGSPPPAAPPAKPVRGTPSFTG